MAIWDKDAESEIEMIKNIAWKQYDEFAEENIMDGKYKVKSDYDVTLFS